jgi:hypothetical protein
MTWSEFKRRVNRWNAILHRDVGYLSVGLTVVFAVSGIAVNHIHDWNPSYSIERVESRIEPIAMTDEEAAVRTVVDRTGILVPVRSSFRPSPGELQIFFEDDSKLEVRLASGELVHEKVSERWLVRAFNYLHLNEPKKTWTYISDVYAVALAFLAVSGLFILKGKNGLHGRGAWLTLIGIAIPILFLIVYR